MERNANYCELVNVFCDADLLVRTYDRRVLAVDLRPRR